MKILVTGSIGFVGSHLVKALIDAGHSVRAHARYNNNKNFERIGSFIYGNRKVELATGDLTWDINGLCEGVDAVIHTAALTFVDRSILSPLPFVQNNILATLNLLEDARKYKVKKFIHVSTDEVYGSISFCDGVYEEDARLNPTNPYSASKAAADCLCISYAQTYGLNTLITRTENNYGPYQHPQKVIPTFVKALIGGKQLPVYGDGQHIRQWLHVSDHVCALLRLLELDTTPGDIYHVAGAQELTNLELATRICEAFGINADRAMKKHIKFIDDRDIRPGHDRRYALSTAKLRGTGWKPLVDLDEGLKRTVAWYKENEWWLQ